MEKSNLLAVDIVVVDNEKNVLLRKRKKEPDAGKWELFGGYPYLDEQPLEKAAKRILETKAGIKEVDSLEFSGKYYDAPGRHPGAACIPLVFIARISNAATTEELQWFSAFEIEELPMGLDNKKIVQDILGGI